MERSTAHVDLPGAGRHFVYTLYAVRPDAVPDDEIACVYVGVTSNLRARLRSHARTKWWWLTIDLGASEFEEYSTRAEAEEWEHRYINSKRPAVNIAGRMLQVVH